MSGAQRKLRDAPVAAVRAAMRVPGAPLAPRDRAHFEAAFGCDLSHVRIHTDELAAAAAGVVKARAFVLGRDIFFAAGAYEPDTPRGRTVIAHEIAHVLQRPRSVDAAELDVAPAATVPGDAAESDANAAAAAIAAGRTPAATLGNAEPRARIARLVAGLIDRRDADDPAQLVARLTETVRTTLASDPDDRLGRVRRTLLRLDDRTRRLVFERLNAQLVSADWRHLIDVLDQPLPAGTDSGDGRELPADGTPTPVDEEPEAAAAEPASQATSEPTGHGAPELRETAPSLAPGSEKAPQADAEAAPDARQTSERATQQRLRGAHRRRGSAAARGPARRSPARPMGGRPAPLAAGGAPEAAEPAEATPVAEPADATPVAEHPMQPQAEAPGGTDAEPAPAGEASAQTETAATPAASATPMPATGAPSEAAAAAAPEGAPATVMPERAEAAPAETGGAAPTQAREEAPPPEAAAPSGEAAPSEPEGEVTTTHVTGPAAEAPPLAAEQPAESADAAVPTESEVEATATRVTGPAAAQTADGPGAAEAAAPEGADGEVTAVRTTGRPVGAAPAGAPPIGDLPSEQDDGREDTGGGGGGGGGAIADAPEEAPAPPAANADPAGAMASVAELPPAQMQQTLGGVGEAVSRIATADRGELANAPPQATPPAAPGGGAPARPPEAAPAAAAPIARIPDAAAPQPAAAATATPTSVLFAPIPEVRTPAVTSNAQGQLTTADTQHVTESVAALPVADPALNVTAGAAPTLTLQGAADPQRAADQREAAARSTQSAAEAAGRDAAQPMGEDHIVPTVPPEQLRGELPAPAAAGGGGAAAAAPAAPDVGVAAVARERSGDEVRAAATGASQQLAAKRTEQQTKMNDARASGQRDLDGEIAANAAAQTDERSRARAEVQTARRDWNGEQRDLVKGADADSEQEMVVARRQVATHHANATTEAGGHIADGNRSIASARADAERKARDQRDEARNESNNQGFFSRVTSAIGSFFDGIRKAIHAAFEAARKLVADAIALAQKLAAAAIDRARNAIVGAIRRAADALIAIGDRVLARFPQLREQFRNIINKAVDAATAAVDRLANALKKAVKTLLDLLGKALTFILDAYEAIFMAAVNVVASAVNTAINAAKAVIQAIGVFAQLVRDVASNPGQWLRNLGAALMDGVRNHLWRELKAAIKEWFNSKVEAIVGVGRLIFDVLRKGGIAFRRIAAMVWVAVKAAIPRAIIEFLVQRVISMLVPAAAAIMAIIEGLQAAWATASRIIAAVESFVVFLKAVKGGNAGPQFARAVAAAAVAVIDFTANFIISKIARGAKGVGGKLAAIAAKLMALFRRGARVVGRVLRGVRRAIAGAVRAIGRGVRVAGRGIARSGLGRMLRGARRRLANTRTGRAISRAYQGLRRRAQAARERIRKWWENRKKNKAKSAAERLDKATREITPKVEALYRTGVSGLFLRARLFAWRLQYRLSDLSLAKEGDRIHVHAAVNPWVNFAYGIMPAGETLRELVRRVTDRDILNHPDVVESANWMQASGAQTHDVAPGLGVPASVKMMQDQMARARASGASQSVQRGFQFGGEVTTSETQFDPRNPNAFVRFPRHSDVGRSDYPGMVADLRTIQGQAGTSDRGIAKSVRELIQRGELPGDFEHRRRYVAATAHLMFLRESVRNPMALATAPMTLKLIERGEMTFEEAFAAHEGTSRVGGRGRFPPSMEGHQRAFDELEAERAAQQKGQPTPPRSAGAAELARREISILETWLLSEMRAEGMRAFVSQGDAETFIRNRLLAFYKLRRSIPGAVPASSAGVA